jgi:hypothetical protein
MLVNIIIAAMAIATIIRTYPARTRIFIRSLCSDALSNVAYFLAEICFLA